MVHIRQEKTILRLHNNFQALLQFKVVNIRYMFCEVGRHNCNTASNNVCGYISTLKILNTLERKLNTKYNSVREGQIILLPVYRYLVIRKLKYENSPMKTIKLIASPNKRNTNTDFK